MSTTQNRKGNPHIPITISRPNLTDAGDLVVDGEVGNVHCSPIGSEVLGQAQKSSPTSCLFPQQQKFGGLSPRSDSFLSDYESDNERNHSVNEFDVFQMDGFDVSPSLSPNKSFRGSSFSDSKSSHDYFEMGSPSLNGDTSPYGSFQPLGGQNSFLADFGSQFSKKNVFIPNGSQHIFSKSGAKQQHDNTFLTRQVNSHQVNSHQSFESFSRNGQRFTSSETNFSSQSNFVNFFQKPMSAPSGTHFEGKLNPLSSSKLRSEATPPQRIPSAKHTSEQNSSSPNSHNSREHPLGEHPNRTLFVRNISSEVDDQDLREKFEVYGNIRNMYTACKHRGFVMISYYDIRDAKRAMKNLQDVTIGPREIDIHYSLPKENPSEKDMNQGTLVVFNLSPNISNDTLQEIFGKYGTIKEIRETPNKKHHKFIEFYDTRDADEAMKNLNKTDINGKRIKIEHSRPGGRKRQYDSNSPSSFSSQEKEKSFHGSPRRTLKFKKNGNEKEKTYSLDLKLVEKSIDKRTTLMIKNIPNKYTQLMLLEEIDIDFRDHYDFFYLPIDFKNKCNVGYAFINFLDPKSIIPFAHAFNRKRWQKFNSEKVCQLNYGRIQGYTRLVEHFKGSSLYNEDQDCRPVFKHDTK